jgi:hypothetical protein
MLCRKEAETFRNDLIEMNSMEKLTHSKQNSITNEIGKNSFDINQTHNPEHKFEFEVTK